ncbi:hypothetical protein ABTW24_19885 [Sphingobacterium thalpophilum]|uniref:Uncharacterized protein n=1 Tax=Sphingobacterium thalpophilum TaxID=259 RepID=A0ABV4HHT7_9SPHI
MNVDDRVVLGRISVIGQIFPYTILSPSGCGYDKLVVTMEDMIGEGNSDV